MIDFISRDSSRHSLWRAIILFGRNVASYKFALGKALLGIAKEGKTFVALEDLADPFAKEICDHLKLSNVQGTSRSSTFLNVCRSYNNGEIEHSELIAKTAQLGFINVIDAFHVVNRDEVPTRFFEDERSTRSGIVITDELLSLAEDEQIANLDLEADGRTGSLAKRFI